jgi:hypothetical protein
LLFFIHQSISLSVNSSVNLENFLCGVMASNLEHPSFDDPGSGGVPAVPGVSHGATGAEGGPLDSGLRGNVVSLDSAFDSFRISGSNMPNDSGRSLNANLTGFGMSDSRGRVQSLDRDRDRESDANYRRLSSEISKLTSIILETRNAADSRTKRFKEDSSFKNIGNKMQYKVNAKVLIKLDEAIFALEGGNSLSLEAALYECRRLLEERNHDIIVADTSEFGWATVSAYQNRDVAYDDNDDKKIKYGEGVARALKKSKTEAAATKGRGRGRGRGYENGQYYNHAGGAGPGPYYDNYGNQQNQNPFPAYPGRGSGYYGFQGVPARPQVQCYGCQGYGHIKPNCPSVHANSNPNKSFTYGSNANSGNSNAASK